MRTQSSSQSALQQAGLALQTIEQHEPSSQPGLSWASKHPPRQGQVQPLSAGTLQSVLARLTQAPSQADWQHVGSAAQTPLQQAESRQPGVACCVKQSPSAGHASGAGHTATAASAQLVSHAVVQQVGSTLHTATVQSRLAQPGDRCGSRQPSVPVTTGKVGVQRKLASRAQTASQRASQQNGSMVPQISVQQVPSLQPGR